MKSQTNWTLKKNEIWKIKWNLKKYEISKKKKKKKKNLKKNDIYKENEKRIFSELKNFKIQSMSVSEIVTVRDGQDQVNASVQ